MEGCPVGYRLQRVEELNSGPPKTYPSSGKEKDVNPGSPDYQSSALPLGYARLPKETVCGGHVVYCLERWICPGLKSSSLCLDAFLFGGPEFNPFMSCKWPASQSTTGWNIFNKFSAGSIYNICLLIYSAQ